MLIEGYKVVLREFYEINRLKINQDIKENLEISHRRNEYIKLSENLTGNLSLAYDELVNDITDGENSLVNYNYSAKSAFVKGIVECLSIGANTFWKSKFGDSGMYSNLERYG